MGGRRPKKRNEPEHTDEVRTRVRQRAILRTNRNPDPDLNDWDYTYPEWHIGWLYDVLESLDWKPSALDVLRTEAEFPGLYQDLGTESWQRKIIRDQMGTKAPKNDG